MLQEDRLRRRARWIARDGCSETALQEALPVRRALFDALLPQWLAEGALQRDGDGLRSAERDDTTGLEALARDLVARRPEPDIWIDQCPVTPESLARRVAYMHALGDVDDQRLLCLGDNDFVSVFASIAYRPTHCFVLDIDKRVLGGIRAWAEERDLPITLAEADFRKLDESPGALAVPRVDVVTSDPPYTEMAYHTYIAAAQRYLGLGGILYLVVPYMEAEAWSSVLMQSVQEDLLRSGFVVTDLLRGFQTFSHEDRVVSSLVRAERLWLSDWSPLSRTEGRDARLFYTLHRV